MAEGYLRHVAGDRFQAMSAGTEPKELNPLAVEAMREIGIDISHHKSKDVASLLGQHIPYVVTVCDNAKKLCPIFPRTYKFLFWSLDDPAAAQGAQEEKLAVFRRIRDEIAQKSTRNWYLQKQCDSPGHEWKSDFVTDASGIYRVKNARDIRPQLCVGRRDQ
jgi:arsenate reductase